MTNVDVSMLSRLRDELKFHRTHKNSYPSMAYMYQFGELLVFGTNPPNEKDFQWVLMPRAWHNKAVMTIQRIAWEDEAHLDGIASSRHYYMDDLMDEGIQALIEDTFEITLGDIWYTTFKEKL